MKPLSAAQVNVAACPATCFGILLSTQEIIYISAGESGYRLVPQRLIDTFDRNHGETNDHLCDRMNALDGVSKAEREAMETGSMFGWEVPGANPANYTPEGRLIPAEKRHAA